MHLDKPGLLTRNEFKTIFNPQNFLKENRGNIYHIKSNYSKFMKKIIKQKLSFKRAYYNYQLKNPNFKFSFPIPWLSWQPNRGLNQKKVQQSK
jgi:hypothetical protein